MSGVISGFVAGAANFGARQVEKTLGEAALAERDARLAELAEKREIATETRKRDQAAAVGAEAESARTGMVDDLSGTARPRTQLEESEAEAGVYRKHGLIEAADRAQERGLSRQERAEARLDVRTDRNADNVRADIREVRLDDQSRRQHAERMSVLNRQLATQEGIAARKYRLDDKQSTALTTNIKFMVENGIAKSPGDAFTLLRTRMERSPEKAIEQIAMQLVKSGGTRYRGEKGQSAAVEDARNLLSKIDAGGSLNRGSDSAQPLGPRSTRRPLDAFQGDEE